MRVIFLLSLFFVLCVPAYAQIPESFSLVSQDSAVKFQIISAIFPIEGNFQSYTGKLIKIGKLETQFEIVLDLDVSSVKFTGDDTRGLPLAELIASVKNSTAHFEGKPISRKSDGSINISGILKWRGKSYAVNFPVRLKSDENAIVLDGKFNGNGEQLAEEVPALGMFQIKSVSANAKLLFKKSLAH